MLVYTNSEDALNALFPKRQRREIIEPTSEDVGANKTRDVEPQRGDTKIFLCIQPRKDS